MNLKNRKRCTYAVIVFYNLCSGIGYGIIFPTIWNYVHLRLGGDSSVLGLVISAYSISSLLVSPLIGWWNDKTQNTKCILFVAVLAEFLGSIMYFVGMANWVLILSRLISGLGAGGAAAVIADITRTTAEEERTPILSLIVASGEFGLILGPALNLGLSKINTEVVSLPLDKYTSPGLFMSILWLVLMVGVVILYHNLTALKDEENIERLFHGYRREESYPAENAQSDFENSGENVFTTSYPACSNFGVDLPAQTNNSLSLSVPNLQPEALENYESGTKVQKEDIKTILCRRLCTISDDPALYSHWQPRYQKAGSDGASSMTDNMIETAEHFIQSASESYHGHPVEPVRENRRAGTVGSQYSERLSVPDVSIPSSAEEKISLLKRVDMGFFRDEIIVLLGLSFFSSFAQAVLETVITPLAQRFYNFDEMKNSYVYLCGGIEVILIYIALRQVSRKVSDRVLLIFGITMLCIATALPLLFVPSAKKGDTSTFQYFVLTIIIDLMGIAVIIVCSSSLLSKIISQDDQAFAQGLRKSMMSLGCIIGPLWGGSYLRWLYVMFAVPLGVCLLIGVLFICSYKRLK